MAAETVLVPGARRVEATLDRPDTGGTGERRVARQDHPGDRADAVVVACPPHPQYGGNRSHRILVAVSEYLAERGIATLRIDYGAWDEGLGEREDVRNAIRWGADRFDAVGVFGYSFGGAMAALAASSVDRTLCAVSLLAPASQVADFDPEAIVGGIESPLQVVVGTRDDTAAWEPIAAAAREVGIVEELSGDHFFVGQQETVATTVGTHLAEHC